MIEKKESISNLVKYYFDKRMIKILLIGIISGFPWVLIGSSLTLWLNEEGLTRTTIGWAGLIFSVYAFNYMWAPLIDRVRIPILTAKIGHRKSWIFLMQSVIILSLIFWSFLNPTENLSLVIGAGLFIAIASSTQDITLDALRIEQINKKETKVMAAGAAITVVGWWTGYKIGGVVSLNIAQIFENFGISNYWQFTFLVMGIIVAILNILLLFIKEKITHEKNIIQKKLDQNIIEKIGSDNFFFKNIRMG